MGVPQVESEVDTESITGSKLEVNADLVPKVEPDMVQEVTTQVQTINDVLLKTETEAMAEKETPPIKTSTKKTPDTIILDSQFVIFPDEEETTESYGDQDVTESSTEIITEEKEIFELAETKVMETTPSSDLITI